MDFYSAVRTRLILDPAVALIVGDRVTWRVRPQSAALPAIVLQLISDPRPMLLKSEQALRETRVQADCLAETHLVAMDLAERSIAALTPEGSFDGISFERSFVDHVRDLGEQTETQFIHRASIDMRIWWQAQ